MPDELSCEQADTQGGYGSSAPVAAKSFHSFGTPLNPPYTVELISTVGGVATLENDWNRLSDRAENPNAFMTYGWFRAWTQGITNCSGRLQPYVLSIKQNQAVVGIVPLIRRIVSRFGQRMRRLEFATGHSDYNDLLVAEDGHALTHVVLEYLARSASDWDLADLRELRDHREEVARLERILPRINLLGRVLPEPEGCPYLPIETGSSVPIKRLSGDARRTLRRRIEKAAEEGLRPRIIENPERETGLLERLVALDWQKHLHRSSPVFVGDHRQVFHMLFDTLGPRGWLYVALLERGDQPVAFQMGFRCGKKLWDYNKAYDPSFSRFAPGTLLMLAMLDYGSSQGFAEYDFLRGEESYKTLWSFGCYRRFRLLIWNRRWMSRLYAIRTLRSVSPTHDLTEQ